MMIPSKLYYKYWPAFEAIEKLTENIFLCDDEGFILSKHALSPEQIRILNALNELRQGAYFMSYTKAESEGK